MQLCHYKRERLRSSGLHATLAILVLAASITAAAFDLDPGATIPPPGVPATEEVNARLSLIDSTVVSLDLGGIAATRRSVRVPIDGSIFTLDLRPHSVRSATYEVVVQLSDGSYVSIEPSPVRTFRGTVAEIEGSVVAASLLDDGLHARIIFPNGDTYWIEPLAVPNMGALPDNSAGMRKPDAPGRDAHGHGAGARQAGEPVPQRIADSATQHLVYHNDDVIPSGGTCMLEHPPVARIDGDGEVTDAIGQTSGVTAGGLFIAELAIDADFEYFLEFEGADDQLAATEAQINSIINAMNVQYERDVAIQHIITKIIIRTAEEDPYDTSDPRDLLEQFRSHWQSSQSSFQRDVAQLFTGKNMNGSTIGIAWLQGICSRVYGYSVVESNCDFGCSTFACKTDLSAHELGHNWAADHCGGLDCSPSCPNNTMNCSLRCANQFHENETIPQIIAYRDLRTCLDLGDELRRIVIEVDSDTVWEGDSLQFTAIADFRFAGDVDITSEATWSVDRPGAGSIDGNGLFTAFDVSGDVCVTVSASYAFDQTTHDRDKTIVVIDQDAPLDIIASDPPDNAIDARQPSDPDGSNRVGWQSIDITFNGETCLMTPTDFMVIQQHDGGTNTIFFGLQPIGQRSVRVFLLDAIEAGTWTTVTHLGTGLTTRIGFLPGDVTADGMVDPSDIFALMNEIEGLGDPLPLRSTDIDRSGLRSPADILREIDLLNGAEQFDRWNGRTLP